ncbi:MAG: hypothetical protein ABI619_11665, partial [Betaproteobacteria bacterium]
GGTRSGLVSLEVTAVGEVVNAEDKLRLKVSGSNKEFELAKHTDEQHAAAFAKLQASEGEAVKLTGVIDNYAGQWPGVLKNKPVNPRRILVTGVELAE